MVPLVDYIVGLNSDMGVIEKAKSAELIIYLSGVHSFKDRFRW